MPRAPLQVLVIPFRVSDAGDLEYAVFKRANEPDDCWQGIAGGAEDGETATQAARREMGEEAGIPPDAPLLPLDTVASIRADVFRDRPLWGAATYVVLQRAFGVHVGAQALVLSEEHTEYRWVAYADAARLLRWDSNQTALWELNERLQGSRGAERGDGAAACA